MDTSQYFYRCALFQRTGEKVSLVDPFDRKLTTDLDPWLAMVVSLADGQHTIDELTSYVAGRYPNGQPDNLAKTLHSAIDRLIESKAIMLSASSIELPYYLETPADEHDVDDVKKMMLDDGFIVE
ncbi:MAG: hypothetical protein KAG18_08330 [Sinobacterium sp.]|nr:hypothetical protein [Sinobacterium sp.]